MVIIFSEESLGIAKVYNSNTFLEVKRIYTTFVILL